jgi:hypothetical protein
MRRSTIIRSFPGTCVAVTTYSHGPAPATIARRLRSIAPAPVAVGGRSSKDGGLASPSDPASHDSPANRRSGKLTGEPEARQADARAEVCGRVRPCACAGREVRRPTASALADPNSQPEQGVFYKILDHIGVKCKILDPATDTTEPPAHRRC